MFRVCCEITWLSFILKTPNKRFKFIIPEFAFSDICKDWIMRGWVTKKWTIKVLIKYIVLRFCALICIFQGKNIYLFATHYLNSILSLVRGDFSNKFLRQKLYKLPAPIILGTLPTLDMGSLISDPTLVLSPNKQVKFNITRYKYHIILLLKFNS